MGNMLDTKESALMVLHELSKQLMESVLVKNLISESTMETITRPIASLDWEGKEDFAEALISILKSSKTEKEVIDRASNIFLQ